MVDLWDRLFNRNRPDVKEAILKERALKDKIRTVRYEGEQHAKLAYEEALAEARIKGAKDLARVKVEEEIKNGGKSTGGFGEFAKNFTQNMNRDTQSGKAFNNPLIQTPTQPSEPKRDRMRSRNLEDQNISLEENNPFESMRNPLLESMDKPRRRGR